MRRDFKVDRDGAGRSLRTYLSSIMTDIPSKGIRRAIQRGQITVDGERVSSDYRIDEGQNISVHIQDKFNSSIDLKGIKVLFEDAHMAAIFKPEGIEIHGGRGPGLAGALKQILTKSHLDHALLNPVALHRLDKPTCGVLLIAKSQHALKSLSQQFQTHSIGKQYLAVVHGALEGEINITDNIDLKPASTYVTTDSLRNTNIENITALKVFPKTGRKHQIRRHLASRNLPIVGDKAYGITDDQTHLLLCAESITFQHPEGDEMTISAAPPDYFQLQFS